MKKLINTFLILSLSITFTTDIFGQCNNDGWILPCNKSNTRFTSDNFNIPRPALSLRGFDNTIQDGFLHSNSEKTYGVRQLLEKIYGINTSQDEYTRDLFEYFINKSNNVVFKSDANGNREFNASLLEVNAFMALISYIIEENSTPGRILEGESTVGLEDHSHYRDELINELENRNNFIRNVSASSAFKSGKSLMRLARAWDLYLALENAYEDLGGNLSNLLDASDKQFWNNEIHRGIKELWQETHKDVVDVPEWVDAITNEWAGTLNDFADVQLHEVQAGNWPLISYAALGVAALGFNGSFSTFSDDDGTTLINPSTIIYRAIKAADFKYWNSNNKRMNYWWYQTGGGKEYWAEGSYYFETLLPPIIEFWHVIRSNDKTASGSKIEAENNDPFNLSGFLNPIKWHYNIATPDGNTPPLDDGNIKPIQSAGLLSWDVSYGDNDLGKKFAFIRDLPEINALLEDVNRNYSRLVEISYSHVQENQGTSWEEVYGNEGLSETLAQQTIVRKKDSEGTMHYLLMNGERGAAITNGEGHEQVDQLQLLYYVDEPGEKEISYLMDTGYDSGSPENNSTWNHYNLHNVLSYNNAPDGGYNGPSRSLLKKRKVAEHASVEHLYFHDYDNVIHAFGQLPITHYNYNGQSIYYSKYRRNTLFIKEDTENNIPSYIIDSNADEVYPGDLAWSEKARNVISMKYYSDTNILEPNNLFVYRKFCHTCNGANKDLYIYMEPVEALPRAELYTTQTGTNLLVREKNNQDIGNPDDKNGYYASSHGLNYYNDYSRSWTSVAYLQVNNLRPTPPTKQINYSSTNYKGHIRFGLINITQILWIFILKEQNLIMKA